MYRTYNLLCAENIIAGDIYIYICSEQKAKKQRALFRKCHKMSDFRRTTQPKGVKIRHALRFKASVIKNYNDNNISSTVFYQTDGALQLLMTLSLCSVSQPLTNQLAVLLSSWLICQLVLFVQILRESQHENEQVAAQHCKVYMFLFTR